MRSFRSDRPSELFPQKGRHHEDIFSRPKILACAKASSEYADRRPRPWPAGSRSLPPTDRLLRRPHRGGRRPLWESLAQNHSFIDGNKRTGFAATYTFLAINGARIAADAKAAYVFIAGLYETNDFTFEKLAAWLRDNVEPASP